MSSKRKGVLTVSGEWMKHLRRYGKRAFWRNERLVARAQLKDEVCKLHHVTTVTQNGEIR